jgi:hypothetical protein
MNESSVIVAFRMELASLPSSGNEGYLERARSVCSRCVLRGGRIVAWGETSFAFGWPGDRFDDVVGLVEKLCGSELSAGTPCAIGLAEGQVDLLSADGSSGHLAWGNALVGALAMARAARLGEVVVDDEVRAFREGRLSIVGERMTVLGHRRVRGWRLDMEQPWARPAEGDESGGRATLPYVQRQALGSQTHPSPVASGAPVTKSCGAEAPESDVPGALADPRTMCDRVDEASPRTRCRVSLELAMALVRSDRCEDALLEALDALARAREAADPAAVAACMALLAKVYDRAGSRDCADALSDVVLGPSGRR